MTPTDEQIALILDQAHEVPGWWRREYVIESNHRQRFTGEVTYKGPPFSTSPVACFQWVTPVLLELGTAIIEDGETNTVAAYDENGGAIIEVKAFSRSAYSRVTTRALEWAHNNMPERLAEAVRRVREKNRE